MNSRIDSVHQCLLALDRLEAHVARAAAAAEEQQQQAPQQQHAQKRSGHMDSSQAASAIADNINELASNLKQLHQSGSEIYFPVPLEVIGFMDERTHTANPWLYMHQRFDHEMAAANALADREKYYQDIGGAVDASK